MCTSTIISPGAKTKTVGADLVIHVIAPSIMPIWNMEYILNKR